MSTITLETSQANVTGPATDNSQVALTAHEILTLLSLNIGPSATASRELFRLPDRADDAELMEMGMSTLLVRGLGVLEDEEFSPSGPAFGIAASLTTAVEWIELGIVAGPATHAYFLVGSPAGNLVVSVDRLSIFGFRPLNDSTPLLEQAISLTRNALADPSLAKPAVVITQHVGLGGEDTTASIRVAADGSTALAGSPLTADGGLSEIDITDADLYEKYGQSLAF
ncbi:hypothetical protein [Arthrobacter sp. ERGS1:01]|uniref:hypothetical protein n=1 Tax=Arthrobacter sp. ERGS1:01 TaxID=1704044 RepID=UPI0012373236|nr:hypothetical protein [Arthrobacter sp. ERGS1:01]